MDLNSVSSLFHRLDEPKVRENLLEMMQGYLQVVATNNLEDSLKQKVGTSDIVQQSFLRVIEHFGQFKGTTTPQFKAWLKKVVINEIHKARRGFYTHKRDVSKEKSLDATLENHATNLPDKFQTPSSGAIAAERIEIFHRILATMSPDDATVIRLRSIDGLAFREVADRMNRTEESTAKLWYRAVLKFEEKLKIELGGTE